ncbi:MAG: peptidylprolyl isomerase [Myxococcota bacterium]
MSRSPLLIFLLAGLALFGLSRFWGSDFSPPPLEVERREIDTAVADYERRVRREISEDERLAIEGSVLEDALWLAQARALGLARVDPVIQQRLLLNMRFLEPNGSMSDDERLRRAFELGLDKTDSVVRRRLIDRVQALIRAGVRARTPDERALRTHYQNRREVWRVPALFDLSHVYLSRDERGAALAEDADRLMGLLMDSSISLREAIQLGDSFLSGHDFHRATSNQIAAQLGSGFEARLSALPTRRWNGPIETPFGLHLVWIEERIESRIPPYPQVRAQVLEDWFREATRKALRREIERHREDVEIRIILRDQTDRTSAQRDGLNEGGRGPDTHQPELMDGPRRRDMQ